MDTRIERVNTLFLSFVSDHWRKFLFPVAAFAAIVAFLLIPRGQADNGEIVLSEQNPFPELIEEEIVEEIIESTIIVVDVKGAVIRPGVYSLDEGDRLIDAVNAAGGYLPDADSRLLNHALRLTDELLIYVPLVGEEITESELSIGQESVASTSDGVVNINTATESELTTIAGIGPAKATAIIQYREEHGPYSTPEGLMDVTGIGQKTFDKLVHQIKVK